MKVKKKFVRYISHEIRTPLNAVRMGLQFLLAELPSITQDPELLDSLETTETASVAAINILNDLLTFDKIEEGNLKLDRQLVSARELVEAATSIFKAQVPSINRGTKYIQSSYRAALISFFHFAHRFTPRRPSTRGSS